MKEKKYVAEKIENFQADILVEEIHERMRGCCNIP